jgi:hypothetical protein
LQPRLAVLVLHGNPGPRSSRLDFEDRAGILAAADGGSVERASFAEEDTAGGELIAAELEAENDALESDSSLLFERENFLSFIGITP